MPIFSSLRAANRFWLIASSRLPTKPRTEFGDDGAGDLVGPVEILLPDLDLDAMDHVADGEGTLGLGD